MTRESEIEGAAWRYAQLRRWFRTKIMRASPNGFPDHFFARATPPCPHCGRSGEVLLAEFKQTGETPTAQQQLRHQELRAAGVRVEVIDDLDDAKRILR